MGAQLIGGVTSFASTPDEPLWLPI